MSNDVTDPLNPRGLCISVHSVTPAVRRAQHTRLIKCTDDANTYLVNDISDPLQRSLTSLHLTDVLLGAPPPGASSTYAPASSARIPP